MKPHKYTLTIKHAIGTCEVDADKISANDAMLPASIDPDASYNPRNMRLWCIGHEFGALCAMWASCEQDAFDSAVDAGFLDYLQIEESDADEDSTRLGNAGEPFDLTYAWIGETKFDAARDIQLIVAIVRASEAGYDTVGEWR